MKSRKKAKIKRYLFLPALLILCGFVAGAIWFFTDAQAVTIKSVQRGTGTLGGNTKATPVGIPNAVDVQKTMIIFCQATGGNASIESSFESCEFTATDTLYVSRNTAGDGTAFEWTVVEFLDGVSVQNGYSCPSGVLLSVYLPAQNGYSYPIGVLLSVYLPAQNAFP